MIRLGLCCLFKEEPVKFRHQTASNLKKLKKEDQTLKLSELCLHNAENLVKAVDTVERLGIKAFRIMTPLLPLYTHPEFAYSLEPLPDYKAIKNLLNEVKIKSKKSNIRLSLHPDQFNVLNSPRKEVVKQTLKELEYQNLLAEHTGADVINIHLGGVYGDKQTASKSFIDNLNYLSDSLKRRITLENDDRSYTPSDLFKVSEKTGIPVVYDVHHHRCNKDQLSEEDATEMTIKTWKALDREPYFHISSPKGGWEAKNIKAHSDYIEIKDFPECWRNLGIDFTLDVEAKAKELAVLKLQRELKVIS